MKKDTLILKDKSVIELEAGASLNDIRVVSGSRAAMVDTWCRLTPDNLSAVTIKNGDGVIVGSYAGLVLENETSTNLEDGSVLTSFNLREKTDIEKRLDTLEQGQQIQDEVIQTHNAAIEDVGEIMSNMLEGGTQ